jgi:hypothetical protein
MFKFVWLTSQRHVHYSIWFERSGQRWRGGEGCAYPNVDISSHTFFIEKGGSFAFGIDLLYLSYVEQRYPKSEEEKKVK